MMSQDTKKITRREALLAVGAVTMAACFSDRPVEPDDNGGTPVDMTDQLTFEPVTVSIRVGETVTWHNRSVAVHTATGDASKANNPNNVRLPAGASPWDSGSLATGGQFSQRFDVPGEYRYFCIPHESQAMVGTILVSSG